MAYAEKTFYVAVCDACGTEWEGYEYVAWSDREGALAAAQEYDDWSIQFDGRLLCGPCRVKPGGDMYEEEGAC